MLLNNCSYYIDGVEGETFLIPDCGVVLYPSYNIVSGDGSASGFSTVVGIGIKVISSNGSASGSSAINGSFPSFGNGSSSGTSIVLGEGSAISIGNGQANGLSTVLANNALVVGTANGLSTVLANNALAVGIANGLSTISGDGGFLSWFSPLRVLPGFTSDGDNLIIPIVDLPGLTEGEASSTSGSWIDIFQAICIADHLWEEEYTPSNPLKSSTYSSWNNRNMNTKSSRFQYGVGELNTFLKHFTINYGITKLVDEN